MKLPETDAICQKNREKSWGLWKPGRPRRRYAAIMHDHESQRSASVYAVLAILAVLAGAVVWLGFRQIEVPPLTPLSDTGGERRGAGEDILPGIVRPPICDEDRPCS